MARVVMAFLITALIVIGLIPLAVEWPQPEPTTFFWSMTVLFTAILMAACSVLAWNASRYGTTTRF